jgi:hypothetical protein
MPTKGRKQHGADAELRPFEPVSEEVVLAAIDRAKRHWPGVGKRVGVALRDIAEHLGFVNGAWTTRRLRPELDRDGPLFYEISRGSSLMAPSTSLAGMKSAASR